MYNLDQRLKLLSDSIEDLNANVDAISHGTLFDLLGRDKDELLDMLYDWQLEVQDMLFTILE
jgi:hypothetical protein